MATVLSVGAKVIIGVEKEKEVSCVRSSRCPPHMVTKKISVTVSPHNKWEGPIQRASALRAK